jgi:nucleoid-associated protein YgaU
MGQSQGDPNAIDLASARVIRDTPAPFLPQADERFMGRETKILLALLATLVGVFVGVLSMKLLVPRPPAGAGPDVHIDLASTEPHELVDPPSPSAPAPGPASAEPAIAEASQPATDRPDDRVAAPDAGDLLPPPMPLDQFAGPSPGTPPATAAIDHGGPASAATIPAAPPRRDPFVSPAGLQMPLSQAPDANPVPTAESMPTSAAAYVAHEGDSWWGLAERAYGDGRLYRALFAWNRVIDPRVSLTPGTRLEIPPRARLEAAWPKLMPAK